MPSSVADDDDEDWTCCYRALCCNPNLREILVTEPVSKCLCDRFTYANLFWLTTVTVMLLMFYALLYFYLGETMLPGGDAFGLFAVIVFAYFLGWSLAYLPYLNLPPVFGMLLAGIIVRNAHWYNIHEALGYSITSNIRTFSVTFLLLRAGLEVTSSALFEHPLFVLNLAVVPCTMEMLTMTVMSFTVLDYPLDWAFLAGSIIACISPVVPINCMLSLAERGYGEDKEIATLLFTAASIDDIHIVSVYSICFAVIFSTAPADKIKTHWFSYIPGGIRDLLVGVFFGGALGFFFAFFPHRNQKFAPWYRLSGLVLGSLMCTTGASKIAITGGGFLATIIMSLIATTGWRILSVPFNVKPLRKAVHIMWHFTQPVLVGVIGAEMDFHNWTLGRFGLYVLCIAVALLVRTAFAFLATYHTNFTMKERIFIALSWISKGTLQNNCISVGWKNVLFQSYLEEGTIFHPAQQILTSAIGNFKIVTSATQPSISESENAALAPMVFEQAHKDDNQKELATDVVRMAVVSIVFLAPLGAMVMMLAGQTLLNKTSIEEQRRRRELSYLRIISLQPVQERIT